MTHKTAYIHQEQNHKKEPETIHKVSRHPVPEHKNTDRQRNSYQAYMDRITVSRAQHEAIRKRLYQPETCVPGAAAASASSSGPARSRASSRILRYGSLPACFAILLLCLKLLPGILPENFRGNPDSMPLSSMASTASDPVSAADVSLPAQILPGPGGIGSGEASREWTDNLPFTGEVPAAENLPYTESTASLPTEGAVRESVSQLPEDSKTVSDDSGCPVNPAEKLSIQEARADTEYGIYLPSAAPDRFSLESITRTQQGAVSHLTGCWSHGYDTLFWSVTHMTEDDMARIAAAEERERYDMSLYSIPLADSVPDSLWQVVNDPVFELEDLTQDMVNARAYSIQDSGDTDGVRLDFSVCTGDILIRISAKGVSPQWLYRQLDSLR